MNKFRVWDKVKKMMFYPEGIRHSKIVDPNNCGSLIYCDIETVALGAEGTIYILDECGNYEYADGIGKELELLESIGFNDCNGKEIFEGDIICWSGSYVTEDLFLPHDPILGIVRKGGKPHVFIEQATFATWAAKDGLDFEADFYDGEGQENFLWDEVEVVGNEKERASL